MKKKVNWLFFGFYSVICFVILISNNHENVSIFLTFIFSIIGGLIGFIVYNLFEKIIKTKNN